jgi:hypothetical protein
LPQALRTNRRKLNQRAEISDAIKIAGPIGTRSSLLFRKIVDISGLPVTSLHDDCRGRGAGAPVCSPWHLNSDQAIDTMRQNALRRFPRTPLGEPGPGDHGHAESRPMPYLIQSRQWQI